MLNPGSFSTIGNFWAMEKLGQVRLSQHFYLRQFLYSEIAAAFDLPNNPINIDLAIENGKQLCTSILEPIVEHWGPIVVRSGYRSPVVNAVGAARGLKCASNSKNAGAHIWDMPDKYGDVGACACIVVPKLVDEASSSEHWRVMAEWLATNVPFHRATFFQRDFALNVGWNTNPVGEVKSLIPPRVTYKVETGAGFGAVRKCPIFEPLNEELNK